MMLQGHWSSTSMAQKYVRDRSGLALESVKNVIRHFQSEWRDGESVSSDDLLDDTDDPILVSSSLSSSPGMLTSVGSSFALAAPLSDKTPCGRAGGVFWWQFFGGGCGRRIENFLICVRVCDVDFSPCCRFVSDFLASFFARGSCLCGDSS